MDIRMASSVELINELTKATKNNDQAMVNIIAYELATRIYLPNNSVKSFEELLYEFGYKEIKKQTIEEKGKQLIKKRK